MPSTYAHYKFGKQVLEQYPAPLADVVRAHRQLYNIGLHGPDILFYYKALTNNPVNAVGFGMHGKPAREFFAPAKEAYAAAEDKGSALAYLLGFVCHFALDSACHGYIENKIAVSGVTHTEIESEFDRSLLLQDGRDPLSAKLTYHIAPSEANARVIAPFFAGVNEKQVEKALRSMLFYNELLRAPHQPKRGFVRLCLSLTGNFKEMHGMMIAKQPIPACQDSDLRLAKLMDKAVGRCVLLSENVAAYLKGEEELLPEFNKTFGPPENWREIPVLPLKEEQSYEV